MTTTAPPPALARFLEARADRSPVSSPEAGGTPYCHRLTDLLDEALRELAGPAPDFTIVAAPAQVS